MYMHIRAYTHTPSHTTTGVFDDGDGGLYNTAQNRHRFIHLLYLESHTHTHTKTCMRRTQKTTTHCKRQTYTHHVVTRTQKKGWVVVGRRFAYASYHNVFRCDQCIMASVCVCVCRLFAGHICWAYVCLCAVCAWELLHTPLHQLNGSNAN